jgi:hypothetical protein
VWKPDRDGCIIIIIMGFLSPTTLVQPESSAVKRASGVSSSITKAILLSNKTDDVVLLVQTRFENGETQSKATGNNYFSTPSHLY